MRTLVTGVSGFLGRAATMELVERGAAVTGVSRSIPRLPDGCEARLLTVDLCEPTQVRDVLDEVAPQVIIHLATSFTVSADGVRAAEEDVLMWRNLAASMTSVERIIVASTELGRGDDDHLSKFQRLYVGSKCHIENMALENYQRTRVSTMLYRFPHLAGATEDVRDKHDGRIMNRLLRSAMGIDATPVEIYVPHLTQLRYLHIQDAASVLADHAADADGFSVRECGAGAVVVNFGELVYVIGKVVGTAPKVNWRYGAPTDTEFHGWRLSKAERMVRETVEWFTVHTPPGQIAPRGEPWRVAAAPESLLPQLEL